MRYQDVAERQHALLTLDQALACGLTVEQVRWLVRTGRWARPVRGVYRIAGAPVTWLQTAMAACLAGPHGTVASYLTSVALPGLGRPLVLPHVTVPRGASTRLPIARVHRAELQACDVTQLFGIPCTTVPRSIVDCGAVVSRDRLVKLVDDAFDRGLADVQSVLDAMARASAAPGRKGFAQLREVLEPWTGAIQPGSPAEARLLRRLAAWGFPTPEKQHEVRDAAGTFLGRIDVAWPHQLVGLEYDSTRFHNPRRWAADEIRHAAIERAGWRLLRVEKLDLRPGERRLRDELDRILRRRAA